MSPLYNARKERLHSLTVKFELLRGSHSSTNELLIPFGGVIPILSGLQWIESSHITIYYW